MDYRRAGWENFKITEPNKKININSIKKIDNTNKGADKFRKNSQMLSPLILISIIECIVSYNNYLFKIIQIYNQHGMYR